MDDSELKNAMRRALLTSSREGMQQLEKELSEEKHDREFQTRIAELEKISSALLNSNNILQKQIEASKLESEYAKQEAKKSNRRMWISIGLAGICCVVEIISLFLKGFHIL